MEEGKNNCMRVGLKPTPERKKFGYSRLSDIVNQNILFQSHVFKTWEHNSPLPSIFCLLNFLPITFFPISTLNAPTWDASIFNEESIVLAQCSLPVSYLRTNLLSGSKQRCESGCFCHTRVRR